MLTIYFDPLWGYVSPAPMVTPPMNHLKNSARVKKTFQNSATDPAGELTALPKPSRSWKGRPATPFREEETIFKLFRALL